VIQQLSEKIPVCFLCRHFGVSRSHFYKWKTAHESTRAAQKSQICEAIRKILSASKETYGSPRIHAELLEQGMQASENTVAKYMNEMGLDGRLKKKFRVITTDSNHSQPIAPRLFETENHTVPEGPGQVLAGDITYLRIGTSFIYLAIVMDLYNREILGWSMSWSLETKVVLDALDMAMRKVGPDSQVVFHSDRGSQYASEAYRKMLKNKNIKPSMSRKGNCYDNAYVESWFSSLKKEWIYRRHYSTAAELKTLVFEYIETWYNKRRKYSSLGNLSPEMYKMINKSA
jgi:transposase InsO family protein